jgi:transcriptional regulator with XRE-family HTH domain
MIRLKYERLKRGWSQQTCAVQAGMHGTEISKIERGYLKPYPSQAKRLATILEVDPSDLLEKMSEEVTYG